MDTVAFCYHRQYNLDKRKSRFAGNYTARELYDKKLKAAQKKADHFNTGGNDFKDENLSTDAKDMFIKQMKKHT